MVFLMTILLETNSNLVNGVRKQDVCGELEECAANLKVWRNENRLKMNNDKTEFILSGSKPQLDKCKTKTLDDDNTEIELVDKIKYLGVILDQNLNLKKHINI